eukprot:1143893-Pelagomonas_calceolata.AAC.19
MTSHNPTPTCGCEGVVGQQRVCGLTDLDASIRACGLHAAGSVPGVAHGGKQGKDERKSIGQ